jgi:hypothetical protein
MPVWHRVVWLGVEGGWMGFTQNLGGRLAILFAGLSLACGVLVYAAPDMAHKLLELLTHSTWSFTIRPFNAVEFFGGALLWGVIGYAVGALLSCPGWTGSAKKGKKKK